MCWTGAGKLNYSPALGMKLAVCLQVSYSLPALRSRQWQITENAAKKPAGTCH